MITIAAIRSTPILTAAVVAAVADFAFTVTWEGGFHDVSEKLVRR